MNNTHRKTNIELITDMMEFSNNGVLIQAFIIEAVHHYSSQVIKAGPKVFDNPMVSGESWVACAKEAIEKIDNR